MALPLAGLLLVGCGGGSRHALVDSGGGGAPGAKALNTFLSSAGETKLPLDLSDSVIQGIQPQGEGFQVIAGAGLQDGTWFLDKAPDGPYWLRVARNYYWVVDGSPDLGQVLIGRPDSLTALNPSTQVSLQLDGLRPWAAGDFLEWTGPNQGTWTSAITYVGIPAPIGGDTRFADLRVGWMGNVLSDASKGDSIFLTQMGAQQLENGFQVEVVRGAGPLPLTQVDGEVNVAGAILAPPAEVPFELKMDPALFWALAKQVHPGAYPGYQAVRVFAHPTGLAHGWVGTASTIWSYTANEAPQTSFPGVLRSPYPADWTFTQANEIYRSVLYIPSAGANMIIEGLVGRIEPGGPSGTVLGPRLTPVQNFRIDGLPATRDGLETSLTPALAWDPPAQGEPSGYWVQVNQIYPSIFGPVGITAGNLYISGNGSLRMPPDLLRPGIDYYVRIRAYTMAGLDFGRTPHARSVPYAYADTFSGLFHVKATASGTEALPALGEQAPAPDMKASGSTDPWGIDRQAP